MRGGPVPYSTLVRHVQKYRPSDLLRLIAYTASRQTDRWYANGARFTDLEAPLTPAALIEVARESIVHAIDYHARTPTLSDLRQLCGMVINLDDPYRTDPEQSLERFLLRTAFDQFGWQLARFEELARPHALFVDAATQLPTATAHTPAAWQEVLGCSLDEFVAVGFALHVHAFSNDGVVDLDDAALAPLYEVHPRELVDHVVTTLLAATRDDIRQADGRLADAPQVRFNPLVARPLLHLGDGRLLAPHPMLLLDRVSVNGLYYDRCRDKAFTDQLGNVLETYVGMNLRLIADAEVRPEIEYNTAGGKKKTVDWILVLPDVVVLVEVKATPLTEGARAGLDALDADRERTVTHAADQLERTYALVRDRHPGLSWVPTDRPLRGLIVTREPYWGVISGTQDAPTVDFPTSVVAIREIEHLGAVGQTEPVGAALLALTGFHSNGALVEHLPNDPQKPNPILAAAYDRVLNLRAAVEAARSSRLTTNLQGRDPGSRPVE